MKPAAIFHPPTDSLADELALMRSVADGSAEAFEAIVDRFQMRVGHLARRLLGTDADDVAQDVFVIVLEKAGRFRGECSLWTWLTRITLNQCRNRIRRRQVRRRFEQWFRRTDRHSPAADARATEIDEASVVRQAINALPGRDREVIVLVYLEGQSPREIAATLGQTVNGIEVRLSRARGRLREMLQKLDVKP